VAEDERFDPAEVVSVFAASRVNAEMIRALLEGSGVPAIARGGSSGAYPLTVGALGEAHVLVREQDVERAREIIADAYPDRPSAFEQPRQPWTSRRIAIVVIAVIVLVPFAAGIIAMIMALVRN
jgi:hypothetical protein